MKQITIFLGIFLCIFLCSCYDDLGNYEYKEINEIAFEGIDGITLNGWNEKIAHVDTLKLYPQFNSSLAKDESAYTYEWKFIPDGADETIDGDTLDYVVATTRNLIWPVTLAADDYRCFFTVTDTVSHLRFTQKFYLRISTMTSEGWMVLCNQDGVARLDMIVNVSENEDIISRDIWSESDFMPGVPEQIIYNFYSTNPPGTISLLVTDKGTFKLDQDDLHAGDDNNLRWSFGAQPERIIVRASGTNLYDWVKETDEYYPLYWVIVDDKGDVYCNTVSEVGGLFEFPINEIDGQKFEAAPFVGVAYRYFRQGDLAATSTLLFDKTNQRFVEIKAGAGAPSVMKFESESLFSVSQEGKEMVFMQNTNDNGLTYAILKDGAGDYYYYGIKLGSQGKNTQECYGKLEGPDLDKVTHFACHPNYGWLFYATKDMVYKFDMNKPERGVKVVASFPGETIRVLKFNPFVAFRVYEGWQDNRTLHLVVGSTVDGASLEKCGIVRTYDFATQWEEACTLKKEHKDLGNIIDIAYKEKKL